MKEIAPELRDEVRVPFIKYYLDPLRFPEDKTRIDILFKPIYAGFYNAPIIAYVDDQGDWLNSVINVSLDYGFVPHLYLVNSWLNPTDRKIEELYAKKILKPENLVAVVCDKSMGFVDGIALNRSLSQEIFTIMLTGEPETRETHRVAHKYIEKPVDPNRLFRTILESPYMQRYLKP